MEQALNVMIGVCSGLHYAHEKVGFDGRPLNIVHRDVTPQNVIVTYTAGYPTTPPDIAQAATELVCRRYRERTRIGEVSKALGGGETVTFSQKDISEAVKTALMPYRSAAPAGLARRVAPTMTDPALLTAAL